MSVTCDPVKRIGRANHVRDLRSGEEDKEANHLLANGVNRETDEGAIMGVT